MTTTTAPAWATEHEWLDGGDLMHVHTVGSVQLGQPDSQPVTVDLERSDSVDPATLEVSVGQAVVVLLDFKFTASHARQLADLLERAADMLESE